MRSVVFIYVLTSDTEALKALFAMLQLPYGQAFDPDSKLGLTKFAKTRFTIENGTVVDGTVTFEVPADSDLFRIAKGEIVLSLNDVDGQSQKVEVIGVNGFQHLPAPSASSVFFLSGIPCRNRSFTLDGYKVRSLQPIQAGQYVCQVSSSVDARQVASRLFHAIVGKRGFKPMPPNTASERRSKRSDSLSPRPLMGCS